MARRVRRDRPLGRWIAALVLAAAAGWAMLLDPPMLQGWRLQAFDAWQRWQPRAYQPQPVRVVDIDEASLARLGQWPWPRPVLAELVERLDAAGAAAIAFDVLFAEPDRTSPARMATLWPVSSDVRAQLQRLPDHDARLAQALQGRPVVLGRALLRGVPVDAPPVAAAPPYRFVWLGEPAPHALHGFDAAVSSLPVLEAAAAGWGALSFVPDGDGVVRRVPMVLRQGGQPVPSLVTEALRVAQGEANLVLRRPAGGGTGLQALRVGALEVPVTAAGEFWVHYTPPVPERMVSAWQVLAGAVDPARVAGHIVLVGSSAQGLMDLRASPLGRIMPGVEAHAQALEMMLGGQALLRPHWARPLEAALAALGVLLLVTLATRVRALPGAAVALGLVALAVGGSAWAFGRGWLLDGATPALLWGLAFAGASLVHHWRTEREQRWIQQAFARYVSPNRVAHLVQHPEALELGATRQTCSFVFTDLAGFTGLMERLDPGEALGLLNRYLEGMIGIAFAHQGTLDRIVGDAVAVMFSAPVPQPDHPRRALDCALAMHAFAQRFAAEQRARGIPWGDTRIGVHGGEVVVGNFGGETIFDYRALGDPVNTAARLEAVNKHLGTRICVSGVVAAACPDVAMRPIGELVLKGKTQALAVFEPLPDPLPAAYAPPADYRAAYDALAAAEATPGGADDPRAAWDALRARHPDDPLVRLHHERLARGERGARLVMREK